MARFAYILGLILLVIFFVKGPTPGGVDDPGTGNGDEEEGNNDQ